MRRLTYLLIAALAAAGPAAPEAGAATYTVRSCDNGSISGWYREPFRPVGSTCGTPGGALHARNDGWPGETAHWRFAAPPDTEIAGFDVTRAYWLNATVPYGSPVYALLTSGAGARYSHVRANLTYDAVSDGPGRESASGLTGQRGLEISVTCGGGGACRQPAASFHLLAARIDLRDVHDPVIGTVSGTLTAAGPLTGVRTLHYAASDRGGGVGRAELEVDGTVVRSEPIGACALQDGGFAEVVPCKPSASGSFGLDTTALAEGPHVVTLRVVDATGVNADRWSRGIEVDNVPAAAAPVPVAAVPAGAAPAAPGTAVSAWLERAGRRAARLTVPYGVRVRVRGRAAAGVGLSATQRVAGKRPAAITGVRTRPDGTFTAFTRIGPSRRLRFSAPDGARSRWLTLSVQAAVRLRARRHGAGLVLSGALRGGHVPPDGVLVLVRARRHGRWTALTGVRTDWRGRFRTRVPAAASWRQVRATVPRQPGYPFARGSGPVVEVVE